MDYETGIRLDLINEKLDLLMKKAYPEKFKQQQNRQ